MGAAVPHHVLPKLVLFNKSSRSSILDPRLDVPQLDEPARVGNHDILPVFVALWLASAGRLGLALSHHETFGTELTIVFLTVVVIPLLIFSSRLCRS